ncbi:peptide/nickel transport system permease protein [Streptosporangium becharense]|uniref:Peptide/nickel transport system permease protein n=1 Tax=Streptosporangium becharense TaxID=1816182 RepID=A0A7W9MHB1_9ACTN|nr:ABC transporter permease subunit [Streptosporangium becharense]MBB2914798.1 peptide/nickel transport system permease protein [Streptosporangium becharense]MBB5820391.1 peptide/nickel transport system permease protein [Streptosporangium becharense]
MSPESGTVPGRDMRAAWKDVEPERDVNPERGGGKPERRVRPVLRWVSIGVLLGVPTVLALAGPLLAGEPSPRGVPFGSGSLLGTDFVGRDVGEQVLAGGRTVVTVALAATALAYLVGTPLGMLAAMTRRRWLDELLMRPLDLLLAIPSLLLLILLAATAPPGPLTLIVIVAVISMPEVARVSRAAALEVATRPAMEAMLLQGETWWRRAVGYVGRSMLRTLLADLGVRVVGALYLVATASFLGVGVPPDATDWAVMVDRNRTGMFLQPWAVVVPALLLVMLSVGLNLLFDGVQRRREEEVT